MKIDVLYNDYGPGYLVKSDAGDCMMVNIERNEWFKDSEESILRFGQWQEMKEEPAKDVMEQIEKVLENGKEI